jgi:putative ATP-binding cassette transporter
LAQVLSVGEQQRVAIARALLLKPDWLFLDEATSAMSEQEEAGLYCALVEGLPATTIVSIGHRRSLEAWHPRVIKIEGDSLVRVRRAKPQGRSSELDRAGTEDGSFSPETSG